MWDFEFAQDDSFLPMSFGSPGTFSLFGPPDEPVDAPAFNFQTPLKIPPPSAPAVQDDRSALLAENAELREKAMSLKERFVQSVSLNERLKSQLDECRLAFRNAIFSGFGNRS
jgi:hypothetical protein